MDITDLKNPSLYINRELSLLEFNRRVIEQTKDENLPLLERLRFLCIASTNLDEFFEIRVAGLKQQAKYGSTQTGPDNLLPAEVLTRISDTAHQFVEEQYHVWNDMMIPALTKDKIRLLRRSQWKPLSSRWIHRYFKNEVLPVLSPIGLDPAHPFPRVLMAKMHLAVNLGLLSYKPPALFLALSKFLPNTVVGIMISFCYLPSFTPMSVIYFRA